MERFINSGTECIVLMRKGDRALIVRPNKTNMPFVVPFQHKEGASDWWHGQYFNDLSEAYVYFDNLGNVPINESLQKEIDYAKVSYNAHDLLYKAHGRIDMARELGLITKEQYMTLNHSCVADGINNPKFF